MTEVGVQRHGAAATGLRIVDMPADNHDVELWLRNGRMYRRGLDKRQPGAPPRPAKTVASTRVTSEHSSSLANRAYPRCL